MTRLTVRPGIPYRLGEGDRKVALALKEVSDDPRAATLGVVRDRRTVEHELHVGDQIELAGLAWTVVGIEASPRPRLDLEEAS
ncbi:DUF6406 domain-containing protein [Cellulomonas sp. P5_C5]